MPGKGGGGYQGVVSSCETPRLLNHRFNFISLMYSFKFSVQFISPKFTQNFLYEVTNIHDKCFSSALYPRHTFPIMTCE